MQEFTEKIDAIIKVLENSSAFEIVEYKKYPGISKNTLKEVESYIEAELSPTIKGFFSYTNGFKFHWKIRDNIDKNQLNNLTNISSNYFIEVPENESFP